MLRQFIQNIKLRKKWYHRLLYDTVLLLRRMRLPFPRFFGAIFYNLQRISIVFWRRAKQFIFYEPMLRYRCGKVGTSPYLEVNFPLILGYGTINIGNNVTIGGNVTFIASYKARPNPTITIGDNVYLGYETLLSCADSIRIGSNVRIAEGCRIFDNNNHPLDPAARKANAPVGDQDIAPVVLEDETWIGSHATILKGVTIGKGAVVATGAVVSKNVAPLTIVAGNPARVVKEIKVDT
jgi:acetyltransferase-like isoleucine patch superfamily enzyme